MGRPNRLPSDILAPIKLRMERLKWVDGDYDAGGSYWGGGSGDFIYCAWCVPHNKISGNPSPLVQVFVRAKSRKDAKALVRDSIPFATFFN
jgi:hypothetical protein